MKGLKVLYNFFLYLGISIIILSILFKLNHWPGNGLFRFLGYGFLGLFFSPLFVFVKIKENQNKIIRFFYSIGTITLFLVSIGISISVINYDFGKLILKIGQFSFVLLFIPTLIYSTIKVKENRKKMIKFLIISFILLLYLLLVPNRNSNKKITNMFEAVNKSLEKNNTEIKNSPVLLKVEGIDDKNIKDLINRTEKIINLIYSLKGMIEKTDDEKMLNEILFEEHRIAILEEEIISYNKFITDNYNKLINLKSEDYSFTRKIKYENDINSQFKDMPKIAVKTLLNQIENDILRIEKEVINKTQVNNVQKQ